MAINTHPDQYYNGYDGYVDQTKFADPELTAPRQNYEIPDFTPKGGASNGTAVDFSPTSSSFGSDFDFERMLKGTGSVVSDLVRQVFGDGGTTDKAGKSNSDGTGIMGSIQRNPKAWELIGGAVGAHYKDRSDKEHFERIRKMRADELQAADQLKQAEAARLSAATASMTPARGGLISSGLVRGNGAKVFKPTGALTNK